MKGSPADLAGIKAGDYITHLDGKLIYGGCWTTRWTRCAARRARRSA
jgi:predicted metalloprotease with PDZ domain